MLIATLNEPILLEYITVSSQQDSSWGDLICLSYSDSTIWYFHSHIVRYSLYTDIWY